MDKSRITAAIWPWGVDKPEQMEQAAQEITKIGYTPFESVKQAIYAYNLDLPAYRDVLDKYGLIAASFYFHFPVMGEEGKLFETLDKELEFVAALGVKRICLQASKGRPGAMDEAGKAAETALVERFAKRTKSFGITTNLHNHHNTWVMYEDEINFVLDNIDPAILSFAPDTAHLVAGNCDPVKVIRKYAARVNFTHLKDIKSPEVKSEGVAQAGVEVYSNFCELGQGCVNFAQIFGILKKAGYDGPLCEELDRAPVSNYESAKNNYEFIVNNY
jgi:inosose dehydratase